MGTPPTTLLEPESSIEALQEHLQQLYQDVAPGWRFILRLTDMAMPTTNWQHLLLVRQRLQDHPAYPIQQESGSVEEMPPGHG